MLAATLLAIGSKRSSVATSTERSQGTTRRADDRLREHACIVLREQERGDPRALGSVLVRCASETRRFETLVNTR
jgi:hypothetical protein